MGITIEACSCLKKGNEEQTEFKPKISQNNQKTTTENSVSNKTSCVLSLKFSENKPFSFTNLKGQLNTKRKPELTIQAVTRAYLFRKKYFKEQGIKEQLTLISNQTIKKKWKRIYKW